MELKDTKLEFAKHILNFQVLRNFMEHILEENVNELRNEYWDKFRKDHIENYKKVPDAILPDCVDQTKIEHIKVCTAYVTDNCYGEKREDVNGRTYSDVYDKFGHAEMVKEYLSTNSWGIK